MNRDYRRQRPYRRCRSLLLGLHFAASPTERLSISSIFATVTLKESAYTFCITNTPSSEISADDFRLSQSAASTRHAAIARATHDLIYWDAGARQRLPELLLHTASPRLFLTHDGHFTARMREGLPFTPQKCRHLTTALQAESRATASDSPAFGRRHR